MRVGKLRFLAYPLGNFVQFSMKMGEKRRERREIIVVPGSHRWREGVGEVGCGKGLKLQVATTNAAVQFLPFWVWALVVE